MKNLKTPEMRQLWTLSILGMMVSIFIILDWPVMVEAQKITSLLFIGIIFHLWEEQVYPGEFLIQYHKTGFLMAMTNGLHYGFIWFISILTLASCVFPSLIWLGLASAYYVSVEVIFHIFCKNAMHPIGKHPFYSPGLISAAVCLLPLVLTFLSHILMEGLVRPMDWLISFAIIGFIWCLSYFLIRRMAGYTELKVL